MLCFASPIWSMRRLCSVETVFRVAYAQIADVEVGGQS